MQTATVILTLFLGVLAVLQGGINRVVAESWGLTPTILLNNCVIMIAALGLYVAVKFCPQIFPEAFIDRAGFSHLSWYYFLPGLCGLALVAGVPFAIDQIGAANVFIGIVCAQMVASLIWDSLIEGIVLTWPRVMGALFAIVGVAISRIKT